MSLLATVKDAQNEQAIIGIAAYEPSIEAMNPGKNVFIKNDDPRLVGTSAIAISLHHYPIDIHLFFLITVVIAVLIVVSTRFSSSILFKLVSLSSYNFVRFFFFLHFSISSLLLT
jgi:hypothetical protein